MWDTLIIQALAISALSLIIAKSEAGALVREAAGDISDTAAALTECFYCVSVWFAFLLALLTHPAISGWGWLIDIPLTAFALVTIAAVPSQIIILLGQIIRRGEHE